jgi:hypothetical protein
MAPRCEYEHENPLRIPKGVKRCTGRAFLASPLDAFEGATDGVPVQAEARGWEAEAAS